jgi:hypothetical protein
MLRFFAKQLKINGTFDLKYVLLLEQKWPFDHRKIAENIYNKIDPDKCIVSVSSLRVLRSNPARFDVGGFLKEIKKTFWP